MDSVSKAILETVGATGFTVIIDHDRVAAINQETGERFIVRFDADHFYDAVVQLAQQVGIELEDG